MEFLGNLTFYHRFFEFGDKFGPSRGCAADMPPAHGPAIRHAFLMRVRTPAIRTEE
jgi:hypothetical protein